jgi:radical SAM superfamily enzyme YgiQ (UPF0313 family)
LGHQPFGLASPAAWLEQAGLTVTCNDLAVEALDEAAAKTATLIAIYIPMHTATRMVAELLPRLRALNPSAHINCYGLYGPVNSQYLQSLGANSVVGGEFEGPLLELAEALVAGRAPSVPSVSLAKQNFQIPRRGGLPALSHYGKLDSADERGITKKPEGQKIAGYTEASRGCKHTCLHCPIVPVYKGAFRIVQRDVVMADIRNQVALGARHITFGDPDFFNGPSHAMALVKSVHQEFPELTYDVTIKVEHLLRHDDLLPTLVGTGCVFVTTAVEAVDDDILAILDKGHTVDDFHQTVALANDLGLVLAPTFMPFTPWTTLGGYAELLTTIADLDLIDHVAPVQLAIRLLVTQGSGLLDLPDAGDLFGDYHQQALSHVWRHPDPAVDNLQIAVAAAAESSEADGLSRRETFHRIRTLAQNAAGLPTLAAPAISANPLPIPHMSEPWFCCAEPTVQQFATMGATPAI